jgi:hypothetical protein
LDFLCLEKGSIVNDVRPHSVIPSSSLGIAASIAALFVVVSCGGSNDSSTQNAATLEQGKQTFRYETFGDEVKWTDTLRMHEVVAAAVDPATALSVGLKVDADALPQAVVDGIKNGTIDLKSPATTVALLQRTSASPARCAIRPSMTRSRRASASASTVGRIAT